MTLVLEASHHLPSTADRGQQPVSFDVDQIRQDFPILKTLVNGKPLVYLDNGATTQKPQVVIDRISQFYSAEYGTVRRGVYALSAKATQAFEAVRHQVADFMNAPSANQVVFTKGTTEAINLVVNSFARARVTPGTEVIISTMEHHANLVPWQQLCLTQGATLRVIPISDSGELDLEALQALLGPQTRMLALTHVSNVLGTINPIKTIVKMAHEHNVPVLVDGAQAAPHIAIDVQELDADFYVFSGHKVYGPTGIGVLFGKAEHLAVMTPYQFGGDMIEFVTFEKTTFNQPPQRFEAGTPPIAEVIGLGAALAYVSKLGLAAISAHEQDLLTYATQRLQAIPEITIVGTTSHKAGVIAFVMDGVHPHDIGSLLDQDGVAVRAGHHCAQPLMQRYGHPATARVSFGLYNTREEVDVCIASLQRVLKLFA